MEKGPGFKKNKPGYYNYKSPLLFSIPLDIYSDEVVKLRNKNSFLKMQKLEKKCQQLKKNFGAVMERHSARIETTRYLVLKAIAVNNNIRGKKTAY